MSTLLKGLFVPGTVPFLVLALIPGALLLYRRPGRIGRVWISGVVLLYWLMSTPVVAAWLVQVSSPEYPRMETSDQLHGASAIVVLGAGSHHYESGDEAVSVMTQEGGLRVLEAARIYRMLSRPWVIVTGGAAFRGRSESQVMAEGLEDLGVPRDRILLEEVSMSTHEHAMNVPRLLTERGVKEFVLVTSPTHIRRSLRVFSAAGLHPIPAAPEAFAEFRRSNVLERYLPSDRALSVSGGVMYDGLGMVYYWLRGWL
jgi:uncharacterized SAM-binding protein YcdF (DUF218 family)